ncbi:hypothetical protein KSP35_19600 [Aquihabitans sp. G128]|uniref:hypothetical protein n=1 Tax=Aquihabitans sp. G128 TaxID=2849779 RepID=UPI001C229D0A|nr:hypothetical protein [Aquihabitans sp. G128]QXC60504.1 hypothetical protein KSP35_19600 [Aquihabitans sp. G128]
MFRKKVREEPSVPLTFAAEDLPRLESILDEFLATVGTPQFELPAIRLGRAGGIDIEHPERVFSLGPDATKRPWRWLLLGVEEAVRQQRQVTLIKASAVVGFWQMNIAPNLGPADWFAMGLDGCPADVEIAVHRAAAGPMVSFDDTEILATDARGDSMTVGLARQAAEFRLNDLVGL